jgi:hypothetical protein
LVTLVENTVTSLSGPPLIIRVEAAVYRRALEELQIFQLVYKWSTIGVQLQLTLASLTNLYTGNNSKKKVNLYKALALKSYHLQTYAQATALLRLQVGPGAQMLQIGFKLAAHSRHLIDSRPGVHTQPQRSSWHTLQNTPHPYYYSWGGSTA